MGINVQGIEGGALHPHGHAVEVGDDGVGVEVAAVVELDPLPEVEGPLLAVLAHLPAFRQAGDGGGGVILGDQGLPYVQDLAAIVAVLFAGGQVPVPGQHDFSVRIHRGLALLDRGGIDRGLCVAGSASAGGQAQAQCQGQQQGGQALLVVFHG